MSTKIQIHGTITDVETFEALVNVLALYTSHTVCSNGYVTKVDNEAKNLGATRTMLIEANMADQGLHLTFEWEPHDAREALMEFGRAHEVDITVKRTWGMNGDGDISFVRAGGMPLKLALASGKPAVGASTLKMLKEVDMCSIQTIERLLSVLDDAALLPRFAISDDVVREILMPKRPRAAAPTP